LFCQEKNDLNYKFIDFNEPEDMDETLTLNHSCWLRCFPVLACMGAVDRVPLTKMSDFVDCLLYFPSKTVP